MTHFSCIFLIIVPPYFTPAIAVFDLCQCCTNQLTSSLLQGNGARTCLIYTPPGKDLNRLVQLLLMRLKRGQTRSSRNIQVNDYFQIYGHERVTPLIAGRQAPSCTQVEMPVHIKRTAPTVELSKNTASSLACSLMRISEISGLVVPMNLLVDSSVVLDRLISSEKHFPRPF